MPMRTAVDLRVDAVAIIPLAHAVRSRAHWPSTQVGGFSVFGRRDRSSSGTPGRRHRRRRDRPRGRRRGAQGRRAPPASTSTPSTTTSAAPATCATARCCPTRSLDEWRGLDALLLGAVGTPGVPPGRDRAGPPAQDALRPRPLHQPAALHLARRTASTSIVIRENTEGTYAGEGGFLRKGTPHEVATQGSVNTRMGVERCVRYAFELAREPRAQAPHAGAQDQRAHLRRRPVAAHLRRGRRRVPRRRRPPTTTSTPPASTSSSGPQRLRRDRHRQPLRRHPHRPRRRRIRRHRLRRRRPT